MNQKKRVPLRKCVGCQESKSKKELIRIVRESDGGFAIDLQGHMNGRGAYICPCVDCLDQAIRRKGLERSFQMKIPEEVYDNLRKELESVES